MKKPASGSVYGKLGFVIDDLGLPSPFASMTDDEVAKIREDMGRPDWQPVLAQDVLPGYWTATEIALSVHGVQLVDFAVGGSSRAIFRLTKDFMYGSAYSGFGARWRDDAWELADMGGTARLWRWPLRDIVSIDVIRTHKMLKLRDEELLIRGATPDPDASSTLRFGGLDTENASTDASDGSPFLGFAEHLAKLVADARGTSVRWNTQTEGKDKRHTAAF